MAKLFKINSKELTVTLTIPGDFGHAHETHSVIVEFFRAVNCTLRENNPGMMSYTPCFPHYDPEANLTTCLVLPCSNTYVPSETIDPYDGAARNADMAQRIKDDFAVIETEFAIFIKKFTANIDGHPSEFDKHHELIMRAKNAPDPVDFRTNVDRANQLLDEFIVRNQFKIAHSKPRKERGHS